MKVPEPRIQNRKFSWLKLLLGLTLLAVLVWIVDWRQSWAVLRQARLDWLVFAGLAFPLGVFLSSFKWQLLLKAQGAVIPGWTLFRYYFIGFFANNFFISNVGGDVVRLILLRNAAAGVPVAASIVMERLTGLAGLLALALGAMLWRPDYFTVFGLYPLLLTCIFTGLSLLIGLFFFNRTMSKWLERRHFTGNSRCSKWQEKLRTFALTIMDYANHPGALFACLGISVIFYLTPALLQWLLFRAVDVSVPFWTVFLIVPLVQLIAMLPVSFNALGLAEGATVLFFSQAGVAPAEALAVALLARFLGVLVSGLGGLFWFFEPKHLPLSESD